MSELVKKFDCYSYNCNNASILDRKLKKLIPCPYCSERKKELANQGMAETVEGNIVTAP